MNNTYAPNWNLKLLKNTIAELVSHKQMSNGKPKLPVKEIKHKREYNNNIFTAFTDGGNYTFRYLDDAEGNLYIHPFGDYIKVPIHKISEEAVGLLNDIEKNKDKINSFI
jgi:hypothetical protein